MKHRNHIVLILLVIAALIGGGWWLKTQSATSSRPDAMQATGVIEARQAALANEIGGQIIEVLVEEGDRVKANQPLIRLDDALLQKQRARAQAELDAAKAGLKMLEVGATKDQLDAAQAQLFQADANLRLAQAALDNASVGTRPEDLATYRFDLDQAREQYYGIIVVLSNNQWDELESALTQAKDNLARATRRQDAIKKDTSIPDYVMAFSDAAVADAQSALDAIQKAYDAAKDQSLPYYHHIELLRAAWQSAEQNETQAKARLDGLQADSDAPSEAIDAAQSTLDDAKNLVESTKSAYDELSSGASAKRLDSAWDEVQDAQQQLGSVVGLSLSSAEVLLAQVDAATGQHHLAAANLSALQNGARPEEIQAAKARVQAAQAQLDAVDLQLSKLVTTAPWDGVILTRSAEIGQVALPGATLIEIGRLDELELTVYLPEEKFGVVVLNQTVQVRVDAYPVNVFAGKVVRMANEAEFTPTNVQTKEDRTRLVYAVVIKLDNSDLELKPGMIADVEFTK